MSEPHLSAQDLSAFATRSMDASRVQAIFAHLSSCAMCRERSQQALDADRSVERLVEDVTEQKTPARVWRYALAACLAIAGFGVFLFLRQTQTAPPQHPTRTGTVVVETATQPVPTTTQPALVAHPVVEAALKRGALAPPAGLAALLATPGMERTRGEHATAAVTYEPNRMVVATQRPRFLFPAERGIPSVVRVYVRDREVIHSERMESGEWTPPTDLPRGVTYTWQVESTRDGEIVTAPAPPVAPARFIVLDAASFAALEEARREQPRNHLLLGILSARAGLREAAQNELRIAANESGDPRVAALLRSVRNWPQ